MIRFQAYTTQNPTAPRYNSALHGNPHPLHPYSVPLLTNNLSFVFWRCFSIFQWFGLNFSSVVKSLHRNEALVDLEGSCRPQQAIYISHSIIKVNVGKASAVEVALCRRHIPFCRPWGDACKILMICPHCEDRCTDEVVNERQGYTPCTPCNPKCSARTAQKTATL
jgi:hypothetical protein